MSGLLTHSPADVIRHLLIDLSLGTLPSDGGSWPIYAGAEPDSPDSCVTVFNTVGKRDGRAMPEGQVIEHPGVQIRVRSPTEEAGYDKVAAIAVALDSSVNMTSVVIGSSIYVVNAVSNRGQVIPLGKDPTTNLNLWTINAVVTLRQSS